MLKLCIILSNISTCLKPSKSHQSTRALLSVFLQKQLRDMATAWLQTLSMSFSTHLAAWHELCTTCHAFSETIDWQQELTRESTLMREIIIVSAV